MDKDKARAFCHLLLEGRHSSKFFLKSTPALTVRSPPRPRAEQARRQCAMRRHLWAVMMLFLDTAVGSWTTQPSGIVGSNASALVDDVSAGPAVQRGHARALLDDASTCSSIVLSGFVLVDGTYEYMGYTTLGTTTGRYFYSSATGYYIHEFYSGAFSHWFIQSQISEFATTSTSTTGLVYYWGGATASTWPTEVTGSWTCYNDCSNAGGSTLTSTGADDLVTCAPAGATCADVETTECPWGYTDCKGLDLRAYTNDKFHWMGCCSNGCSASSWCGWGASVVRRLWSSFASRPTGTAGGVSVAHRSRSSAAPPAPRAGGPRTRGSW